MKIFTLLKNFIKKGEDVSKDVGDVASIVSEEALLIKQRIARKKLRQRKITTIFVALFLLVLLFAGFASYSQYQLHKLASDELLTDVSQGKLPTTPEEVIAAVSNNILLPQGVPQIAQVEDASKLKQTQAFFKDAENGDIVLVYDTLIILYRPSKDIVVAQADISGVGQKKP